MKRICLQATDRETYGDDYNISVDIALTDEGFPSEKMTGFGVRGGLSWSSDSVEPFIIHPNGAIDFGTAWEDDRERYFNIRGSFRKIMPGELFTFKDRDEGNIFDITYRVVKVIDIE